MFILVYINNIFIISKDFNIINTFKNNIFDGFYITNLRLVFHYLSRSIIQTKESINLNLKSYLKRLFLKFEVDLGKFLFLPIYLIVSNFVLLTSKNYLAEKNTIFEYKAIIGLLKYSIIIIYIDFQ